MMSLFRFLLGGITVATVALVALAFDSPLLDRRIDTQPTYSEAAPEALENILPPTARAEVPRDPTEVVFTPSDIESTLPSTSNLGEDQEHASHDSTATAADASASSTSPATTTPASQNIEPGSTVSGDACPCQITGGVVELKGNINLRGDLVVTGGTLMARPGVSVNGNGFQIMFMSGASADFQGTKVFTWSGNGSNASLSRDIEFRNMRRIMFHGGAGRSTLKYFSVIDSGTPAIGDYPVHFHLNGNSVRGTVVEGVVILNGKNHAFVPHGSHGITFKDTIAKNIIKEAYWWDPPGSNGGQTIDNSNDIVYDHALAIGVDWPRSVGNCCSGHHRVSAFLLGAGSGNVIRNSVSRETRGGADCSGFHWPEHANHNPGGNVWTFSNNATYSSNCHGIFVWQNDGNHHVVDGFNGSDVDHGAYVNRYDYRNINVSSFRVHALGWQISNSTIGDIEVVSHSLAGDPVLFTNVKIDSFTINNAADGGNVPGTYILTDSGLSCQNIVYQTVVPGTQVIIDGQTC